MTNPKNPNPELRLQEDAIDALIAGQCVTVEDAGQGCIGLATPAAFAANQLAQVIRIADRIVNQKEAAFASMPTLSASFPKTSLEMALMQALDIDVEEIRTEYPEARFHPLARIFMDALELGRDALHEYNHSPEGQYASKATRLAYRVSIAQRVFTSTLEASRSDGYRNECQRLYQGMRHRVKSAHTLIDHLFERRSRLLCVRVDLRYKHFFEERRHDPSLPGHPRFREACEHRKHLLRILRSELFASFYFGYILRMEWAPGTGFHFHLMVLVEGRKLRDGITLGDLIGEAWAKRVTMGQGFHFNCNKHAANGGYRMRATGTFERTDLEGRHHLLQAAEYLAKTDYYLSHYRTSRSRTFFRSRIPVASPKNECSQPEEAGRVLTNTSRVRA